LFDCVETLVDELHIELDALVGIGFVIANLLDFVLGEGIAGVLGVEPGGESGTEHKEEEDAGDPA
jgi:hypothetical protein